MRKNLLLLLLLIMPGMMLAQNTLTVTETTIPQSGGDLIVRLHLSEAEVYTAYQFKVETPEGLSYVTDAVDDVDCGLTTGYDASHQATVHWNEDGRWLGVGVISMKSALFQGTTVELSIPLAATETAVGTKLTLKFTDIAFIQESGIKDRLDDVDVQITIGEPADPRVILDETSATAPGAAMNVDVLVRRSIKAGEWSTIVLPFAMTGEQVKAAFGSDVKLADFVSWSSEEDDRGAIVGISVSFSTVSSIEANHPYLIKVASAISEFTVDAVDIEVEEEPVVQVGRKSSERGWFYGTYKATTVPEENVFLSGNKFWYSTGKTTIKGFRGYFEFRDVLDAYYDVAEARITMHFTDEATGVKTVNRQAEADAQTYDLQGRKVMKPAKKGLYVKEGKKVLVR